MKFKENAIKPGMVIHCPKEEDAKALLEYLDGLGFVWNNGEKLTSDDYYNYGKSTCYFINEIGKIEYTDYEFSKKEYAAGVTKFFVGITEFSDLIEPDENLANKANDLANSLDNQDNGLANQRDNEMSAVEVLEWLKYAGKGTLVNLFGTVFCDEILLNNTPQEIIDKIAAYEAAKKEKPVELEWVDTCKIIRIDDNGLKVVVHEEVLTSDRHIMETEAILEKYVKEHEGNYIAMIEDVCRVKGE